MKLTFLGTGAGVPSRVRNVSCTILKLLDESNEMWMFDCGEGTQQQMLQTTLKPRKVSKIFITHLHGDHLYGLPGFLSSRSFQGGENDPLTVYGPKGLARYIKTALNVSGTHLKYPLRVVELGNAGVCFKDEHYTVTYQTLDHAIQSYGYRVEEAAHPGELLVDKALAVGVPKGPMLGKLKNHEMVTLADGTVLDGNDFVGPAKPGRVVTLFGDTRYCPNALPLVEGANAFVHEATYRAGEEVMAHNYFHSTAAQAAQLAKRGAVQHLYLTHISARYMGKETLYLERDAQKVFPNATLVRDFDEYTV